MDEVKPKFTIGLVGGSDLIKVTEQMGGEHGKIQMDIFIEGFSASVTIISINIFGTFSFERI